MGRRQDGEHGELAGVGERVGDGPLHEPLDRALNRGDEARNASKAASAAKKRCCSWGQASGWELRQRWFPWAMESAQSSRSPMWARIWTGWRPASSKPAKVRARFRGRGVVR